MTEPNSAYGGIPLGEIAAEFGCTSQNIETMVRQALRKVIRLMVTGTTRAPKPEGSGRRRAPA